MKIHYLTSSHNELLSTLYIMFPIHLHSFFWERSGSVVECLSREDEGPRVRASLHCGP